MRSAPSGRTAVVEEDLLARQRHEVLHLVLEHLGEVLLRRGRQQDARDRGVGARDAEIAWLGSISCVRTKSRTAAASAWRRSAADRDGGSGVDLDVARTRTWKSRFETRGEPRRPLAPTAMPRPSRKSGRLTTVAPLGHRR